MAKTLGDDLFLRSDASEHGEVRHLVEFLAAPRMNPNPSPRKVMTASTQGLSSFFSCFRKRAIRISSCASCINLFAADTPHPCLISTPLCRIAKLSLLSSASCRPFSRCPSVSIFFLLPVALWTWSETARAFSANQLGMSGISNRSGAYKKLVRRSILPHRRKTRISQGCYHSGRKRVWKDLDDFFPNHRIVSAYI